MPARSASRRSASSFSIAGASRRTTSPIPGAANGTPRAAACSSTSRRINSIFCSGSWAPAVEVQRLLGEPQSPDRRGRRHGRGDRSSSRNGGLGSIVTSLAQKPGIYTKVHIHGSSGASVGVETDRGATFIAGVSAISEPPLNGPVDDPGRGASPRGVPVRRPFMFRGGRRNELLPRVADRRFSPSNARKPTAAGHRRSWACGGRVVHCDLSIESRRESNPVGERSTVKCPMECFRSEFERWRQLPTSRNHNANIQVGVPSSRPFDSASRTEPRKPAERAPASTVL